MRTLPPNRAGRFTTWSTCRYSLHRAPPPHVWTSAGLSDLPPLTGFSAFSAVSAAGYLRCLRRRSMNHRFGQGDATHYSPVRCNLDSSYHNFYQRTPLPARPASRHLSLVYDSQTFLAPPSASHGNARDCIHRRSFRLCCLILQFCARHPSCCDLPHSASHKTFSYARRYTSRSPKPLSCRRAGAACAAPFQTPRYAPVNSPACDSCCQRHAPPADTSPPGYAFFALLMPAL